MAKLPLRVMLPPGMPSRTETSSPPTGGAVDVFSGPLPQVLLKLRIGELSDEWRSLKTRYRRNSGPKRRLWLPRIAVKLPTQVWTSEEAAPSPDSDWLSCVSEPIWTFGTADWPAGIRFINVGENPSVVRSKPLLTRRSGNSCWVRPYRKFNR